MPKFTMEQIDQPGTAGQIAERLGCSARTVHRLRVRYGLSEPRGNVRWDAETVERIRGLLDDGWSYAEVARSEGHCKDHLARRFPGYAWPCSERSRLGLMSRELNELRAA